MLVCVLLQSCARCSEGKDTPALATITTINGSDVRRDYADKLHDWQRAGVGAELRLGDGAKTGPDATAELTFITGALLAMSEGTTVRLLPDVDGTDTALDIESGRAKLRVGERGLSLRTHVGRATIAPSSEVVLTRSGPALGFDVALGALSFRERDTETKLAAGDSVRIGIGMAVVELKRASVAPSTPFAFIVEVQRGELRAGEGDEARTLEAGAHELPESTLLRLAPGSDVSVRRGGARARLRGAGEFVLGGENALLEAHRGGLTLEAIDADVAVRVPAGFVLARAKDDGTEARLSLRVGDGALTVERGEVDATLDGKTETLRAGEARTWTYGPNAVQRGPDSHNLTVAAGQSFVVHAPSVPVAIGFEFGKKCPEEAQLEVVGGRQQTRAKGRGNLAFGAGVRAYALRCIGRRGPGRVVARGTVQVLIDTGTRKLPKSAPVSYVEADGRSYTIYYQNQLPEVVVRWPSPPTQPKFQLLLDHRPIELDTPSHRFRSGELSDGAHTLSFQAQGRRSRTTTVIVRFDNAAPKASLTTPEDRGFSAGDLVPVEGVALPNWKVSITNGTVTQGAGERFRGQVQTSKDQPDIAVRLSHPRLGTHYYLRRAAETP